MKRLKVLLISGSFYGMSCGIGDYNYYLAKSLARTNSADIYVLTSDDAAIVQDASFNLLPVITNWGFSGYEKILKLIEKIQPDLIHIQYPTIKYNKPYNIAILLLPAVIKILFPKVRIITTIHDFSIGHILNRIKQFPLLALSDAIIISNERDRDGMLQLYPYFQPKIKKIYIGSNIEFKRIDESKRLEIKKTFCPRGERSIVYFGFFTRGKRLDLLLESFGRLCKKRLPYRLLMLGRPQTEKDLIYLGALKDKAAKFGISDKVSWIEGPSDDEVSVYLQCADLCVLPFERGADLRRSTLVCCIVHEILVISTINSKYMIDTELDEMGVSRLFDPEKDDLASTIENLLKDKEARERMSSSMRQVKDRFSWYNIANSHLRIYEELV